MLPKPGQSSSDVEYPQAAMEELERAEIRGSLVTLQEVTLSCDASRTWS